MRVLVACEESQTVCKAFRDKGHEAYSCDIKECSGGHPEWHIRWDVLSIMNGNCSFVTQDGEIHAIEGRWDLIIAHPPCTHLAVSGARHFEKKREDGRQREGIELFCKVLNADCDRMAVENPVGIISGDYVRKWFPDLVQYTCKSGKVVTFGTNMVKGFNGDRAKARSKTFKGWAEAMADQWGDL